MTTISAQVGPITVNPPPPPPGPLVRRFGFGYIGIGGLLVRGYSADQFFDGMFLTPPYPSTVNLHITAQGTEFLQSAIRNFMARLMFRASSYPNIKIGLHVAFDSTDNEPKWAEFTGFLDFLKARADWNTIGYIGVFEFFQGLSSTTPGGRFANATEEMTIMNRMKLLIESRGWPFISYENTGSWLSDDLHPGSLIYANGYPNGDTQFLGKVGSTIVGGMIGSDGHKIFPSPGCNSFNGFPEWSLQAFPQGYLPPIGTPGTFAACREAFPPTIRQFLGSLAIYPLQNRQWNYYIAGNNSSDHSDAAPLVNFIGASGRSTYFLWDHPGFRQEIQNWINENPGVLLQGAI